ncbi:hypothetical protein ACVIGB_006503 [Bradyrhizobium sp. USDA 4341]
MLRRYARDAKNRVTGRKEHPLRRRRGFYRGNDDRENSRVVPRLMPNLPATDPVWFSARRERTADSLHLPAVLTCNTIG